MDIVAGLSFEQYFDMTAGSLSGELVFENGDTHAFNVGDNLTLHNASDLDANGDGDIEFVFNADLSDTTVTNNTDMVMSIDVYEKFFDLSVKVWPFEASTTPVYAHAGTQDGFNVYDNTFELAFQQEEFIFVV